MSNSLMVDLDGVICDFASSFHGVLTEHTGKNIPIEQWHEFYVHGLYGISKEAMLELIQEHDVLWKAQPLSGVHDALFDAQDKGYQIHIVTSRRHFDSCGSKTAQWLLEHNIPYDSLDISCHEKGKAEIAQALSPAMVIDDHDINLMECIDFCQHGALLDYSWNKGFNEGRFDNISRVQSLNDAVALLPDINPGLEP